MGEYFLIANLDRPEFIRPDRFGNGIKFWNFAWGGAGAMTGLTVLLAAGDARRYDERHGYSRVRPHPMIGRWAGGRVRIVGDEEDRWNMIEAGLASDDTMPDYYRVSAQHDGWVDIGEYVAVTLMEMYALAIDERVREVAAEYGDELPKSRSILHADGSVTPRFEAEYHRVEIAVTTDQSMPEIATAIGRPLETWLEYETHLDELGKPWYEWAAYRDDAASIHLSVESHPEIWQERGLANVTYTIGVQPPELPSWTEWNNWLDTVVLGMFDALQSLGCPMMVVVDDDSILRRHVPDLGTPG